MDILIVYFFYSKHLTGLAVNFSLCSCFSLIAFVASNLRKLFFHRPEKCFIHYIIYCI